jgi:hypothetical protein
MNDTAAPTDYRKDEVKLLENGRPSFAGTAVERRKGSRFTHADVLGNGPCWFGEEFIRADGQRQMVAIFGTEAFVSTDVGASWTDITPVSPALIEDYYDFASMRVGLTNYLFLVNGADDILRWDGTTMDTLPNPFEGVRFIEVFNDRLYLAGHDGVNIAGSAVGDPTKWNTATDGAFVVRAQTHQGDTEIRGLHQEGTALLVWKRDSTNYVEGFGVRTVQVEAGPRGVSRSVGCIGFRGIKSIGGGAVMWPSERGFELYAGGEIRLVSRPLQVFIDRLGWGTIAASQGVISSVYYPRRYEYWCAVPRVGTGNSVIYVYREGDERRPESQYIHTLQSDEGGETVVVTAGDLEVDGEGAASTVSIVAGDMVVNDPGDLDKLFVEVTDGDLTIIDQAELGRVLFLADDGDDIAHVFEGTSEGRIAKMDTGTRDRMEPDSSGGLPITLRLVGRPFFYGDPVRPKRARHMRITVSAENTDAMLTALVLADGVETARHEDVPVDTSTSTTPQHVRLRVNGTGRNLVAAIESTDPIRVEALEIEAEARRRR